LSSTVAVTVNEAPAAVVALLPAASAANKLIVHVPVSTPAGKKAVAMPVTELDAAKPAEAVIFVLPEGLVNIAAKETAPEPASVTVKFAVRVAGERLLMVDALRLNAVTVGATVSPPVTLMAVGKPLARMSAAVKNLVFPAASATATAPT